MTNCKLFVCTSLDGYIARPDGSVDWLDALNKDIPDGASCGLAEFMAGVDVVVVGRKSYEKIVSALREPGSKNKKKESQTSLWPYGSKPVVVLTSNPVYFDVDNPPVGEREGVASKVTQSRRGEAEQPELLVQRLEKEHGSGCGIYVDSFGTGQVIRDFFARGLVAELSLTLAPIIIGSGV